MSKQLELFNVDLATQPPLLVIGVGGSGKAGILATIPLLKTLKKNGLVQFLVQDHS